MEVEMTRQRVSVTLDAGLFQSPSRGRGRSSVRRVMENLE